MTRILDAHGLLVFLERESGFGKIESLFVDAVEKNANILMTSVNWGEVYYVILRECGKEKANEISGIVNTLPIEIIDVDRVLAMEAARFKAAKRMSYADCFSAALAKICKGEVVTGDKEFKSVENEIKIFWI